ncbi:MAG: hypothetical protein RI976_22 [Actinomycetota bacterium]
MTLRALCWIIGSRHRATLFEYFITCATTKLIHRHGLQSRCCCSTITRAINAQNLMIKLSVFSAQSSTIQTSPTTTVEQQTEHVTQTGKPLVAHIVKTEKDESAAAKVLEARINGTPLEALCGHVWVPSRDPKQLPMCQACKEIYEMYRGFNDELNEQPAE